VGITDTGYGEDHCWAQHLAQVVDVNSTAPFPPIVESGSPLRSVHSAALLTRAERASRDAGQLRLDPRRRRVPRHAPVRLARGELEAALGGHLHRVDALLGDLGRAERICGPERELAEQAQREVERRVAALVRAYNEGTATERAGALGRLGAIEVERQRAQREVARALRPVGEAAHALSEELMGARARVEQLAAAGPGAAEAARVV
jgi:hypothetical protein